MRYYRNCDELPIYNFYKVMETKNYCFLCLDYDEYNELELKEDVEELWSEIYEEYVNISGDSSTAMYYELIQEVLYLETRYKVALDLLKNLSSESMSEEMKMAYIEELREWKYKIDISKPLGEELDRMIVQLKGSENKIRLKNNELEQFKDEGSKNEKVSLIKQTVKLEQALGRNNIDTKKIPVSKWIAMMNEVKEINESRRKSNGK